MLGDLFFKQQKFDFLEEQYRLQYCNEVHYVNSGGQLGGESPPPPPPLPTPMLRQGCPTMRVTLATTNFFHRNIERVFK